MVALDEKLKGNCADFTDHSFVTHLRTYHLKQWGPGEVGILLIYPLILFSRGRFSKVQTPCVINCET